MLKSGKPLYFADEVMFTKSTNQLTEWSAECDNVCIDQQKAYTSYVAVIAAIGFQRGVECVYMLDDPVTIPSFTHYLSLLSKRVGGKPIALFLDNLGSHTSNKAKQHAKMLDIEMIFNVPYSPEYNPIEHVFSKVKRIYKKNKLCSLMENK